MPHTISIRLDDESLQALEILERDGHTRSEAIRVALRETVATRKTRSSLRADAARLAADEADRNEMAAIMADLDDISEPW